MTGFVQLTFPTEYEEYQNLSKLNQFASAIPTKTTTVL
jgi:hypothetical protein